MLFNKYLFIFLLFFYFSFSQVSVCTWNIMNLGKSKSDRELEVMAKAINSYDIIAIQEVVAGYGGTKAVSRLVSILNRKGSKWEYVISNPTTSTNPSSRERYAFIWKPSIVKKIGICWLDQNYQKEIDREPFMGTFLYKGKSITLVSFHAVPKNKNPASEIKYFKFFPNLYPKLNLVFMGDFNCPQSHSVFFPIKKIGFFSVFQNQKTSLRQKCINNDCLASEYDNIFYKVNKVKVLKSGIVPFYTLFKSVKEARKISDHIPIWCSIQLK
jgi:endonuclease/exonuclease/phosphatase family metal-dependent hydrolase